ncbi:DUF3579 domain-containing protein [Paraburkholderia sp. RCC_158]|uniref:DUF3579 domain-containing protein n=1 Tax=Paraburkholderia sp. RCC_158 TaxID=3239220 RepID=UPI0035261D87
MTFEAGVPTSNTASDKLPEQKLSHPLPDGARASDSANMTDDGIDHYLIRGVTSQRKLFRPGDWAERLTGVITLFVGERGTGIHMTCTRLATPVMERDLKCLRVAQELQRVCPDAFEFVMRFAGDNDLAVDICRVANERTGRVPNSGPEASVKKANNDVSASANPAVSTGASGLHTGRDEETVDGDTH